MRDRVRDSELVGVGTSEPVGVRVTLRVCEPVGGAVPLRVRVAVGVGGGVWTREGEEVRVIGAVALRVRV